MNPDVTSFGETHCLRGALGQFRGPDLMNLITAHALKQAKYGAVTAEESGERRRKNTFRRTLFCKKVSS